MEDFLCDVQIAICEQALRLLTYANEMKPTTFKKMLKAFSGEDKEDDWIRIFEQGCLVQPVLILTSLYVKDKENFLCMDHLQLLNIEWIDYILFWERT